MTVFNHFTKEARAVVTDAVEIARDLGAPTVEAEHLLLAISRHDDAVAHALHEHGLDYEGLAGALVAETERSLAAVGVFAGEVTFSPFVEPPRFARSAKWTLELSLRIALERGDRRIGSGHVALAVLRAAHGTVPRALAIAGVDRETLTASVGAAIRYRKP
jgi:ATP-dependent Clp protease ATP-binding subunit ClpA